MAFPDSASLDTFAGADENPIGGNWVPKYGNNKLKVISGLLAADAGWGQAQWSPAGTNLNPNPGFEADLTGWIDEGGGYYLLDGAPTRSSSWADAGTYSAYFKSTNPGAGTYPFLKGPRIPVTPGETYRVTATANILQAGYAGGGSCWTRLEYRWGPSGENWLANGQDGDINYGGTGVKRMDVIDYAPPGATYCQPLFTWPGAAAGTVEGYLDNVVVSKPAKFGPNAETWATTQGTWANALYTGLRIDGGSREHGYWAWFNPDDAGLVRLHQVHGDYWETIAEVYPWSAAAGDSVGIRAIRGAIEAWHKPAAGAWGLVAQAADLQQPNAGYPGIIIADTTTRVAEVGGGTITPDLSATAVFGRVAPSAGGGAGGW